METRKIKMFISKKYPHNKINKYLIILLYSIITGNISYNSNVHGCEILTDSFNNSSEMCTVRYILLNFSN